MGMLRARLLLLLAVLALLQSTPVLAQNRVRADDITLSPEPEWTVRTTNLPGGAKLAVVSPQDAGGFQANLNVTVQEGQGGQTASEFLERFKTDIATSGGTIESEAPLTVDGHPGGSVKWTMTVQGRKIKFYSAFLLGNGKAFMITGTALADSYKYFEKSFEEMTKSVRFLK